VAQLTIEAPQDVIERLRRQAEERGVSVEIVVREALEEKARSCRPLPRSLSMGDSGYTDTSHRIGEEGMLPRK